MPDLELSLSKNVRRKADLRRERIIVAARSLFALHGFHGTGVAEIARVSEVRIGQIYRDFSGKDDLIAALVKRDLSELLDDPELVRAIEAGDAAQLKQWIRDFLVRKLDDETRSLLAEILAESNRNPQFAAILAEAYRHLQSRLAAAATVLAPEADNEGERQKLAELILTVASASLYRQISGWPFGGNSMVPLLELVEVNLAKLCGAA